MLDLTSCIKVIETLEKALCAYEVSTCNDFIRDACIQRFEYSYELCHKMLRRYLEMTEPSPTVTNDLSFPSLIRLGCERGLLRAEWMVWKSFRDARNITSHTYDQDKAEEVQKIIPGFLGEAKYLVDMIQKKQAVEM